MNWIFGLFLTALGFSIIAQFVSFYGGQRTWLRKVALMLGIAGVLLAGVVAQLGKDVFIGTKTANNETNKMTWVGFEGVYDSVLLQCNSHTGNVFFGLIYGEGRGPTWETSNYSVETSTRRSGTMPRKSGVQRIYQSRRL